MKYSLDYSIEKDTERLKAVEKILSELEKTPSASDLELMASYILYGKDENGKNSVQRGETNPRKRFSSFLRKDEKNESLDQILDSPFSDQNQFRPFDEKRRYTVPKPTIDRNLDKDIPGMEQLWDSIDRLEHTLAVAKGLITPLPDDKIVDNSYVAYQLRHQLIDLRRHQYYLKDAYRPAIHFIKITPPAPQTINFSSDSAYIITEEELAQRKQASLLPIPESKYEILGNGFVRWIVRHQKIDYSNPKHICAIMDNYSSLRMELWDKPFSWGAVVLADFERYVEMANLSPLRYYILVRRIDKCLTEKLAEEIQEKFGVKYSPAYLTVIMRNEIPKRIALAAEKHRQLLETPQKDLKRCFTCGKFFPRTTIFFPHHKGRSDGYGSNCKICEKKKRDMKNENMRKMQSRKT